MDLEKAFDRVCREEMGSMLHECGVDGYIRNISSSYDGSSVCVRLGSRGGEYFEVRMGCVPVDLQ